MLRPVAIDTGSCRCESFLPPPDDLEQIAPIHLTGTKGEWGPHWGYWGNQQIWDLGVSEMVITAPIYDHINPGFCGKLFSFRESPQSWINCSRATNNCHLLKDPAAPLGASAAQPCSTKISGRRPKVGERVPTEGCLPYFWSWTINWHIWRILKSENTLGLWKIRFSSTILSQFKSCFHRCHPSST